MNASNKMPSTIKNNRKASKPLMEKRRRARINRSLAELKDMIVCTTSPESENCRRSKLEKADILEMTVRHLHQLHEHLKGLKDVAEAEMTIESITPDHLDKFRAGFHECVKEVNRYLSGSESKLDMRGHRHLTNHLNSCLERFHLPRSSWVQDHSNQTSGQTTSTTSNGHCELDNKTSREKMLPTRDIGSPSQRDCGDHRSLPNHHSSNVHHERRNDQDKMTAATGQHGKNVPDKIVVMLPDPLLPPPPLEMSVWRPW